MKREKLAYGDIFYLELPCKKYVIGKVLFDIEKQCTEKDIELENESYLRSLRYDKCQLIEMYKGIYDNPNDIQKFETLIPRLFVYGIDSKGSRFFGPTGLPYGIVAHEKVDYTKVEFPEVVGRTYGHVRLLRGELPLIIEDEYSFDEESLEGFPVRFGAEHIDPMADLCLYMQGRADLIVGEFYNEDGLNDQDLLYHPALRKKLYKIVGADPDKSYYELALGHGYDLGRFYK
jgi:hypothetical protein